MSERLPVLANPRSDRMRTVASLGRRSFRLRKGLLRVEGPQAVRELLRFRPDHVTDVYATETAQARSADVWQQAREVTRWHHEVSDEVAEAVAPDAQGIFAVAHLAAVGGDPYQAELERPLVVLPSTQDPGNAGVIIRSADAFGAGGVITCVGTVDLTSPKVIRSSAGSIFHLPLAQGQDFAEALARLRADGRQILGTSGADGAIEAGTLDLSRPHAWLMGNEAQGLSAGEAAACDQLVRIDMTGAAESLNVGVASGICLYLSQLARST
ncbi:RNA methyltransferase [Scrofimicrobium sp. R131]|uniref:RNA methyltransferase n=1 Tax=Scrofimicrobium appendicitidis TaxID=3079930 RepID=A0AAU7V510_9ACTO